MKKLLVLVLTLGLFSFTLNDPLSEKDRKFVLAYFNEVKDRLNNDIKGLSDEQLNWKAADSVWSIANCIEHMAISEKNLTEYAMASLKESADPSKKTELKHTDEAIMKMITDRSFKAKAPEGFRPTGQFGSAKDALKAFNERRDANLSFLKSTQEDLRNHFVPHPFLGTIDTYQMMLFMNAHTLRHTLQVEEVKANPAFPKK